MRNLANDPAYADKLKELRQRTKTFEAEMKQVDVTYHPVHPISVDVLEWVKKERPAAYQRMLAGEEIGFKKAVEEYKASLK